MTDKKKITAIIIDDEELARRVILKYLEKHPEVEVVAECENGFDGLKAINEKKPDLVFLDIQMPRINGFELLEVLDRKPLIIFSTAHDEFAIQAFEHSAVDYLLKPYSQQRFGEALHRALQRINNPHPENQELERLNAKLQEEHLQRVVVKTGSRVEVIPLDDIELLEAAGDYVEIHTRGARFLKQKTLSYFEKNLPPDRFVRVHRSYIVPVNRIKTLEPYSKDSFMLTLTSDREIAVSKSGMKLLREKLQL